MRAQATPVREPTRLAKLAVSRAASSAVGAAACATALAITPLAQADSSATAGDSRVSVADPLLVRDQNPLLRGVYLPLPSSSAGGEGLRVTTALQWSNTANVDVSPRERLTVDAETIELDLGVAAARGAWRFRAGLPVIRRSAGVLDSFITSWHDAFGLPDGDRPALAKDAYRIRYERSGRTPVDVPDGTALGDLHVEAGRMLVDREDLALSAWLGAELPTGSESRATGNGAVDVAGWLAGRLQLGERVQLSGQLGVSAPGGDGALPTSEAVGFGTLTLGWRIARSFTGLLQLDAHTDVADDADAKFLQSATVLTIGGRVPLGARGAVFEAGVSEDVAVDRSPDVVFHFGVRWPAFR
jgi:hypothetical protein